jgi:hypothetical protein
MSERRFHADLCRVLGHQISETEFQKTFVRRSFAVDYGVADFDLGTSLLGHWAIDFFIS